MKLLEELFQTAIVEVLRPRAGPARSQRQYLRFSDAIVVRSDCVGFFVGIKKRQQRRLWTENSMQRVDRLLQQRRGQELQRVPHQNAVEAVIGEMQTLAQEKIGAARIGLVRHKVAVAAECIVQRVQDIVGVNAMAET